MTGQAMTERGLTWADLVREEPALAAMEAEIKSVKVKPGERFCANAEWYGYDCERGFKTKLLDLAGWYAINPKLRSPRAYNIAYKHLYRLLPDCRGCGCFPSVP